MSELRATDLHKFLTCDFETGRLIWRPRTAEMCQGWTARKALHAANLFNSKYAGKEAFTYQDDTGYRHGSIFGRLFKAHRVVWALANAEWPLGLIDHANGIRSDNRLCNLRVADHRANARNSSIGSQNTSGCVGVFWSNSVGKWQAGYGVGRRRQHVGFFEDLSEAATAVRSAREAAGFSPDHGRGGL